jgi:phosphate/sulfate permease
MVAWSYGAWIVTLPATAIISFLIMAFTINSPSFAAPLN